MTASRMAVVLWHIPISHYNEKARWALDYKQIPHRRREPMPGLHRLTSMIRTRGAHQRLPILDLDGTRVADSTAIIAALEEYRPEPALYPAGEAERARALELEDYFDEELAPRIRRLVWHHTLGDTGATLDAMYPADARLRRAGLRAMAPVARAAVRRDYGVNEAGAEEAKDGIRAVMDRIESELGGGDYLAGESFTVADLTGAALATPIICPPQRQYAPRSMTAPLIEFREELISRPAGQWVTAMFARHRGTSAET